MAEKAMEPVAAPAADDGMEAFERMLERVRAAQRAYSTYSQEQVDAIFKAAALAANKERIPLAKMAVAETGMGIVEDKIIKNHYAAEYIYNTYKDTKTCGVVEEDEAAGIMKVAEPIGVIGAVIPTTNPTSTAIFKTLLALKTRNGIIISPHPRAKNCTMAAAKAVLDAAVAAGAPADIISWIEAPSLPKTNLLMKEADIILATGGGQRGGDTRPELRPRERSQLDHPLEDVRQRHDLRDRADGHRGRAHLRRRQGRVQAPRVLLPEQGGGRQDPRDDAHQRRAQRQDRRPEARRHREDGGLRGPRVDEGAHRYKSRDFDNALDIAEALLVNNGGLGHTSSLWIDEIGEREKLAKFADRMKACRLLVNTPSSLGGIGDIYNFSFPPSLTLGCGSWGGNSVSENVGVKHLLNIKTVAMRRENMLWFRAPEKVYQKKGCLAVALRELGEELGKKKAFIVTDSFLYANGYTKAIERSLENQGIMFTTFSNVAPDPTLACAKEGAKLMAGFKPDVIIAVGGGSAMDAAKIMWVLYEHQARLQVPEDGREGVLRVRPDLGRNGLGGHSVRRHHRRADWREVSARRLRAHAEHGDCRRGHADDGSARTHQRVRNRRGLARARGVCLDDAREKMANAATMAGMAFANAFLGVMHSMAHKLGAFHHIPHGIANALMMEEVLRFNADPVPRKMGTFPQYDHPHTLERYLEIADALGIKGKSKGEQFNNLCKAIRELQARIGIKPTIRDYVPDEKDFLARLDAMTEQAFDDQCTGANPRYPLMEQAFDDQCTGANPRYPLMSEIKQMYLNAYYGKHEVV